MIENEQQHYCMNLIEVNKKQKVIANQPIYNQQGVLLLAEGVDLDEKRSLVLLQHKLFKPLEQCVGIAQSLSARELFDYLNRFAKSLPGLYAVTSQEDFQKILRLVCLFYEKFPLLQQNLTVLALRAKHIYFQGLFCAMAGLAIAYKLKLSQQQLQATFIASLFHDVGFLYLPPELCIKTHGFTNPEWKALQAHPLIAQRFLAMVPNLPKDIGEAIADHHERIDGTGYPHHLFGDKISLVSQIIAATDNIVYNHSRYQNYGSHAHTMLLIAMKLSDNIYFEAVYDAASILFKVAPAPTEAITQLPSSALLLERQQKLHIHFEIASNLAAQLMGESKHPGIRSVSAAMGRLGVCVSRSGIFQAEQEEWLRSMAAKQQPDEGLQLIEISVMLDQIYDQLVHLKNLLERIVESMPQDSDQAPWYSTNLARIDLNASAFS